MCAEKLEKRFMAVLKNHGWYGRDTRVLVAVSGGSDSMALLHLCLKAYGKDRLVVANMDHCLRKASAAESRFVNQECAALGVRCFSEKRSVPLLRFKGESDETAGRRLRYQLFEEVRTQCGCDYVALGHTRNDLAESVLMNISRGSGLRGALGIPPQRGTLIRPLLAFYRDELRQYLRSKGISWVEDETNDLTVYQRNRVRNCVLPVLRDQVNVGVVEHFAAFAEDAREWHTYAARQVEAELRRCVIAASDWPALDLKKLRRLPSLLRKELLRAVGRKLELETLPRKRLEELDRLVVTSGRWIFQWGSEVDLTARDGNVILHPASEKRLCKLSLLPHKTRRWGGWNVTLMPQKPIQADGECVEIPCAAEGGFSLRQDTSSEASFNSPYPLVYENSCLRAQRVNSAWLVIDKNVFHRKVYVRFTPLKGKWSEFLCS